MKLSAAAVLMLIALTSGHCIAQGPDNPAEHIMCRTATRLVTQNDLPFDFNYMGTGSDKSDELGVPYYN